MGGMIAQTVAATYPDRVASLVSIFSTTGAMNVGQPTLQMKIRLAKPMPRHVDGAVAKFLDDVQYLQGTQHPANLERWETYLREAIRRAEGDGRADLLRQAAAIIGSGNRTKSLKYITAPTLVIHGDRDRIVAPSGGKATAAAIPNATFTEIKGMGHDLADSLAPRLTELIAHHVGSAA